MRRIIATGLLALGGLLALESTAVAQEIQLTGPLAGAPAVRELRWHRNQRFEIAPAVSFTLLDEFKRTIFAGARLQYHFTDWLGIGLWGAYGVVHLDTALTDEIDKVNKDRWDPARDGDARTEVDRNASLMSVGFDFPNQLGVMQWIVAPQITAVPFRGKLAIFDKIFVDTDLYIFGGPAFIGVKEREDFDTSKLATIQDPNSGRLLQAYPTKSSMAIAPTFGIGLTFFTGAWTGFGLEYRAIPFSRNTSGFDSAGGPPDDEGPDFVVDDKDRGFRFNQLFTLSFSFFLPTEIKSSP